MLSRIGRLISSSYEELEFRQKLFGIQLFSIGMLLITGIIVYITEKINPNFFNYPYFILHLDYNNLTRFWPLFLYGVVMAYITSLKLKSSRLDSEILLWDVVTSVLAGIWEELGYMRS